MTTFKPFANDAQATSVGGLNLENGRDRVAVYGNLNLTRDKAGLANAKALRTLLDAVVKALEGQPDLGDAVEGVEKPGSVRNPFG